MFGSSIALGSGVPIVPRGRGFENEEQEVDSRSRILCGLDDLGVGEWILEDTAGQERDIAPSAYASAPRGSGSIFRRGAGVLPDGRVHNHANPCIIMHSRARWV